MVAGASTYQAFSATAAAPNGVPAVAAPAKSDMRVPQQSSPLSTRPDFIVQAEHDAQRRLSVFTRIAVVPGQ